MKKYKYVYSTATYILLCLVVILTAIGAGWNLFNLIEFSYLGALKIIMYALVILLCLLLCTLAVSLIFYGRYILDGTNLICKRGFLKSYIPLAEITRITHFRTSNKLVAYYGNNKFFVIVIDEKDYEDFILTIREMNGAIDYDVQTDGEDTPD